MSFISKFFRFGRRWPLVLTIAIVSTPVRADDAPPTADEFTKLDVNEDGRLSGNEISDAIRPLDKDRDGRVTRDEYLAGAKPTKEAAEKQFKERDVNEDGVLSGTEQRGVEKADRDGDGEVSKQEFLAGFAGDGGAPGAVSLREKYFKDSFEVFKEADVTEDFVLSGTELNRVPKSYDIDSDGSINSDEFFEAYENDRGIGWKTVEFEEGGVKVKLPAMPERLKGAESMKVYSAVEMDDPAIRFEVRVSEVGADIESKAEQFFSAVKERLKNVNQMQILDDEDAPFAGHAGWMMFLQGKQNDFHALRIVLVAKKIYELEVIYPAKPEELGKRYGQRFVRSLTIDGESGEATSSVPAPRTLPASSDLPAPPAPAGATDDDVPPPPGVPARKFPPAPVVPAPAYVPPPAAPSSLSEPAAPPAPNTTRTGGTLMERYGRKSGRLAADDDVAPPAPVAPSASAAPSAPVAPAPSVAPPQADIALPPAGPAMQPKAADKSQGGPPNGKYNLRKISGSSLIGLGELEIRDGKYRWGDEGEFAPFTVDAQGFIQWSAGLDFLPEGWVHESSKYVGGDEQGRPMMHIYYKSARGARDLIDAVIE